MSHFPRKVVELARRDGDEGGIAFRGDSALSDRHPPVVRQVTTLQQESCVIEHVHDDVGGLNDEVLLIADWRIGVTEEVVRLHRRGQQILRPPEGVDGSESYFEVFAVADTSGILLTSVAIPRGVV